MFRIILLTLLCFVVSEANSNTVRVVHFSDPHLFEKPKNRAVEEPINQQTFRRSIEQANTLHAQQKINFVVLTGDIGIEQMFLFEFKDKTGATMSIPQGSSDVTGSTIQALLDRRLSVDALKKSNPDFKQRWTQSVDTLANLIKVSHISTWLLVPGNNDLWDELDSSIIIYAQFVREVGEKAHKLNPAIKVVDFRKTNKHDGTHFEQITGKDSNGRTVKKDLLFVGFDNASFKNNGKLSRLYQSTKVQKEPKQVNISTDAQITKTQLEHVTELQNTLQQKTYDFAYLFYHIPQIDDPWLVTKPGEKWAVDRKSKWDLLKEFKLNQNLDLNYQYSAWQVDPDVRQQWHKVLNNKKIKGLFAGHFHAESKDTYQQLADWSNKSIGSYPGLPLLNVVPPLAIKNGIVEARGFQLLAIDITGNVQQTIHWYSDTGEAYRR
ncbi:MAG: metallophosphoesterase [Algicola sp.]|nr:metallophosphoesterase [Algicola sp.]